jgi:murein DD-endopeptidase MepM/ murein hydrolase activator NlpD
MSIPRPVVTLLAGSALAVLLFGRGGGPTTATVGGSSSAEMIVDAEAQVDRLREEREVLEHRAQILQEQAAYLDQEIERQQGAATAQQVRALQKARMEIVDLMENSNRAELEIKNSLQQMWEAVGVASAASLRTSGKPPVFRWPIEPKLGISAYFHDASYEERMGLIHEAIDIPTEDRSTAHAPADGTVATVADNGMGYSYLVIEHDGGFATVYGHVSYFYVQEGDEVRAGQIVALTGGVPGERGAGRISTGPHLHFEVHKDGAPVDPLPYLPEQP